MSAVDKNKVKATVSGLVGALLYYDRKEDEGLPRGAIEEMVERGTLTHDEIVSWFGDELRKCLPRGPR